MPNILTDRERHALFCHAMDNAIRHGDVRRCEHGYIQLACEWPPARMRSASPPNRFWRDLSPIFDPIRYHRARRALQEKP